MISNKHADEYNTARQASPRVRQGEQAGRHRPVEEHLQRYQRRLRRCSRTPSSLWRIPCCHQRARRCPADRHDDEGEGVGRRQGSQATALWTILQQILKWVEALCAANPEQASLIIQTACLQAAQKTTYVKALLALTWDPVANVLHAEANGQLLKQGRGTPRNTQFNWRVTTDGGKTYVTQTTPIVRTVFTGLTPGAIATVEVCITDSKGTTNWSPGVNVTLR